MYLHTQGGRSTTKRPVETGTQSKGDVDYQWLPEGTVPSKKTSRTHYIHSFDSSINTSELSVNVSDHGPLSAANALRLLSNAQQPLASCQRKICSLVCPVLCSIQKRVIL